MPRIDEAVFLSRFSIVGLISFLLFLFALLLGLVMENGEARFYTLHVSAAFFSLWGFLYLRLQNRLFSIAYIVLVSHVLGILSLLFYLFSAENDRIFNNEYQLFIFDSIPSISLATFVPPASILLVSLLFKRTKSSVFEFVLTNRDPSPLMIKFALFVSINTLFFSFFILFGRALPIIGYLSTVVHTTFGLFIFWIGYWNVRLKSSFPVAIFSILVDNAITVLSGGRFGLFLNLGLLFIGFLLSVPIPKRKFLIALAVIVLPFIYSLIGVMGVVRDRIGRGDEALMQKDRVSIYIDAFAEVVSGNSGFTEDQLDDLGKGRSLNWPNFSVMALSPNVIPYMGFINTQNELNAIFTISGLTSGTSRESINEARNSQIQKDLVTGMANRYGYRVDENTSVEWGLLADAWSKGGPAVYFCFYSLLFVIFIVYEMWAGSKDNFRRLIYTLVLVRVVVLVSSSLPFYFTLRMLLLDTLLAIAIAWCFFFVSRYVRVS